MRPTTNLYASDQDAILVLEEKPCLRWTRRLNLCLLATSIVSFLAVLQASFFSPLLRVDIEAKSQKRDIYRGVNLGGWLVLEPWITPSLFYPFLCRKEGCPSEEPPVIDEQSFCERLGSAAASEILEKHRSTWVTEQTFHDLAASGLNIVRIPMGYWLFGDVPDFCFGVSSVHHLDNAVDWAEKYNIQVLLDMHGAVGGANGMDNSGVSYRPPFASQWGRQRFDGKAWLQPANVNKTRAFLRRIAERYSGRRGVARMGMVNEVLTRPDPYCKEHCPVTASEMLLYYEGTWQNLSSILSPSQKPVLDIGLTDWSPFSVHFANWWPIAPLPKSLRSGVFDQHIYHFFYGLLLPQTMHFRMTCMNHRNIQQLHDNVLPILVGEWSIAMTDCMTWLNGVGLPASKGVTCHRVPCPTTYNNVTAGTSAVGGPDEEGMCPVGPPPEKVAPWGPLQPEEFYKKMSAYMLSAYATSAGWTFWNFKSEVKDPRWSFFDAQERGWIPANLSEGAWNPIALPCEARDSLLGDIFWCAVAFGLSTCCLVCCTCLYCMCGCCSKRAQARDLSQFTELLDQELLRR